MQAYAIFGWFAQVYRDAGFAATTAGLLLGVVTAVSIPLSFVLPAMIARLRNPAPADRRPGRLLTPSGTSG